MCHSGMLSLKTLKGLLLLIISYCLESNGDLEAERYQDCM